MVARSDLLKNVSEINDGFLNRTYRAHLSPDEITDFYCVADGGVVMRLAASDSDAIQLAEEFDRVHDRYVNRPNGPLSDNRDNRD